MLLQFTVSNYLSFRDEQTFSMLADSNKNDKELIDNIFVSGVDERLSLVRTAAMFGANASGKSNFIKALTFLFSYILSSTGLNEQQSIPLRPFKLDKHYENKPTKFEVVLEIKDSIFRYGCELTTTTVNKEWLYIIKADKQRKRERLVFERTAADFTLKEAGWKKIVAHTKANSLLLTVAAQLNVPTAKQIINYIFRSVAIAANASELYSQAAEFLYSQQAGGDAEGIVAAVANLLKASDINIEGLEIASHEMKKTEFTERMPLEFTNFLNAFAGDNISFKQVITMHQQYDEGGAANNLVKFDMATEESVGTGKLFALSLPILETLKHGGLLIIDELESSLHPIIVRHIINLFNSPEHNPHNAQLIFSTHDDSLLNRHTFRRDQIWFAEKGRRGATEIFSLLEFRENQMLIRKDASYDKDYLAGRYGAIPIIAENYMADIYGQGKKSG